MSKIDGQTFPFLLVARLIFVPHQYEFLYEHECFVQPRQVIREEIVIEANESGATTTWSLVDTFSPDMLGNKAVASHFSQPMTLTPHLAWVTHYRRGAHCGTDKLERGGWWSPHVSRT